MSDAAEPPSAYDKGRAATRVIEAAEGLNDAVVLATRAGWRATVRVNEEGDFVSLDLSRREGMS